jgi:hypothetical protein
MLAEESIWIQKSLKIHLRGKDYPLLNIGSSTGHFRKIVQPHIYNNIFLPLELEGKKVVHLDVKKDEGIDVVGNLSEEAFRKSLRNLEIRSVLCSNLLEHLPDPKPICISIMNLLPQNGYIIVTVPYSYPYHSDPIDTFFRPTISELHMLFPATEIISSEVVYSKESYFLDLLKNKRYGLIMLARLLFPFYKIHEWKFILNDFLNARKKYSATCLVLKKKGDI